MKPNTVAQVTFKYAATQPDELALKENEFVFVVQEEAEDEGWGLARKFVYKGEEVTGYGAEGLIPLNFVKVAISIPQNIQHFLNPPPVAKTAPPHVTSPTAPSLAPPQLLQKKQVQQQQPQQTKDDNIASVQSGKVSALKQQLGSNENFIAAVKGTPKPGFPAAHGPSQAGISELAKIPSTQEEPIIGIAEVTFDYIAQQSDELDLKKGSQINILSRDADVGWWKGIDINGTIGVFPYNFVKEIPMRTEVDPITHVSEIDHKKSLTIPNVNESKPTNEIQKAPANEPEHEAEGLITKNIQPKINDKTSETVEKSLVDNAVQASDAQSPSRADLLKIKQSLETWLDSELANVKLSFVRQLESIFGNI